MSDLVLRLALQGLADETAANVMLDAIEETGWKDGRIYGMYYNWQQSNQVNVPLLSSIPPWAMTPRARAWAIAAVLLFENWPTSWPLSERCETGDILVYDGGSYSRTPAAVYDQIRRLYDHNIITASQAARLLDGETEKETNDHER